MKKKTKRKVSITKPKFWSIFIKDFWWVFVVGIVLAAVATGMVSLRYCDEVREQASAVSSDMAEMVNSVYIEYSKISQSDMTEQQKHIYRNDEVSLETYIMARLQGSASVKSLSNMEVVLRDYDTGEIYTHSRDIMFAWLCNEDLKELPAIMLQSDGTMWEEAWNRYMELSASVNHSIGRMAIKVEEICVMDDYTFVPLKGTFIVTKKNADGHNEDYEEPFTVSLESIDSSIHYERIEFSEDGWHFKHLPRAVIRKSKDARTFSEQIIASSDGGEYFYEKQRYGNFEADESLLKCEGIDKTFYVLKVYNINIFETYGKMMLLWYLGALVLVIIISTIIAAVSYAKEKIAYETDAYRRNLTNTLAHDLKTPLASIVGSAEHMKDGVNPEKQERYISMVLENSEYMNNLISRTLELSKSESVVVNEKVFVDLKKKTEDILQVYKEKIQDASLSYEVIGTKTITCDELQITELIDNLISNAVKYATKGTKIAISITEREYHIANDVSIPLGVKPSELLKPYVMGDVARSNKMGSGLGLAIVDNIAKHYGFDVKVKGDNGTFEVIIIF